MPIAFDNLWSKLSRILADRIGDEQHKPAGPVLLPDLQRTFLLIDADEDRCRTLHVEALDLPEGRGIHGAGAYYSGRFVQ